MKTQVETVLGALDANALGKVLPHEHLRIRYVPQEQRQEQPRADETRMADLIALDTVDWFRHNAHECLPNLNLADYTDDVIDEVKQFRQAGGATIVDNTSVGIGRDVRKLSAISRATRVNVVCGTGFYTDPCLTDDIKSLSTEKMTEHILSEIRDGVQGTTIKPGVIGEVGCSWPMTGAEKNSLRASAMAQRVSATPVTIHPGQNRAAPGEIMRLFLEAGGDARRTVMGHLDRTFQDTGDLMEFAKQGTYLEYDFFGTENSYVSFLRSGEVMNDAERINVIATLISEGLTDRILLAHDVYACHQLTKYGGHGYAHLLNYAVPKMLVKGIAQADIDKMLVENPRAWLTYA